MAPGPHVQPRSNKKSTTSIHQNSMKIGASDLY